MTCKVQCKQVVVTRVPIPIKIIIMVTKAQITTLTTRMQDPERESRIVSLVERNLDMVAMLANCAHVGKSQKISAYM